MLPCTSASRVMSAPDELAGWVQAQDVDAMIGAMNRLPVAAGDAIYVPAGLAHVIGEGILLLELQQPSDLSLLLEWRGVVDSERDAFLGLSAVDALGAVAAHTGHAGRAGAADVASRRALFPVGGRRVLSRRPRAGRRLPGAGIRGARRHRRRGRDRRSAR